MVLLLAMDVMSELAAERGHKLGGIGTLGEELQWTGNILTFGNSSQMITELVYRLSRRVFSPMKVVFEMGGAEDLPHAPPRRHDKSLVIGNR